MQSYCVCVCMCACVHTCVCVSVCVQYFIEGGTYMKMSWVRGRVKISEILNL